MNGFGATCSILSSFWYISFKGSGNEVVVFEPFGNFSF